MLVNIYDIIELGEKKPKENARYSIFMLICIILSLIPLCFKEDNYYFQIIDKATVIVFIIDYILRFLTAGVKYEQGALSYVKYPFSAMAIIDLLSILPSLTVVNKAFKALRVIRLTRLTRILRTVKTVRVAKTVRYSKSASIILKVIKDSKEALLVICALAVGYILTTAIIIFNVEPDTFNSYFDAVYWATVSLTTVGYGDIVCTSVIGKVIAMVSSFVGIAIVALPSGIITSGLVKELNTEDE